MPIVFGADSVSTVTGDGNGAVIRDGSNLKVVQGASVADATDAASVIAQLNTLLARLRTAKIIAT